MPVLVFSGYAYRDGVPLGGVRVRAYPVNTDGSLGASFLETSSASGSGYWQLSVDTSVLPSPTGRYDIELFDAVTGQVRWVKSGIRIQVTEIFGPGGAIPLPDGSIPGSKLQDGAVTTTKIQDGAITTAKIQDGAVTGSKIAASAVGSTHLQDGSVTDAKIGSRTVDQATTAAYADTGSLTQILSWLVKRLREILGTTNWSDAVPITLSSLAAHAARHRTGGPDPLTPADIGAAPASHTHPDATPTSSGFMSAADKAKLDALTTSGQLTFSQIKVGATTIQADAVNDVLELASSSAQLTLTPDATNDKVTFGLSQGAGSGLDADTVDGQHASAFALASHTHPNATTSAAGFMSAQDKAKLDGIQSGAEVNQNAFSNVKVGTTTIAATAKTDTVELASGSNVSLSADTTNKRVTIAVNTAGLNADMVDGYHAGNGSGQVAVSNGTLCTNLNADLLDGYHASQFAAASHTHSEYVLKSGDTMTGSLTIGSGADLVLRSTTTTPYDPGDIVFTGGNGSELGRIWVPPGGGRLMARTTNSGDCDVVLYKSANGYTGGRIYVQSTAPTDARVGDIWIDTSTVLG